MLAYADQITTYSTPNVIMPIVFDKSFQAKIHVCINSFIGALETEMEKKDNTVIYLSVKMTEIIYTM